jgi:hypothetical protein
MTSGAKSVLVYVIRSESEKDLEPLWEATRRNAMITAVQLCALGLQNIVVEMRHAAAWDDLSLPAVAVVWRADS